MFYKIISEKEMRKGVRVNFVGVYPLKWGEEDQPTDGFVEASDGELIEYLEDRGAIIRIPPDRRKETKAKEKSNGCI